MVNNAHTRRRRLINRPILMKFGAQKRIPTQMTQFFQIQDGVHPPLADNVLAVIRHRIT